MTDDAKMTGSDASTPAAPTITPPATGQTTQTAPATTQAPKPKTQKPKAAKKPDIYKTKEEIDDLHAVSSSIDDARNDQVDDMIEDLKKKRKLKLSAKAGVHTAAMLGVSSSSPHGDVAALRNWANAARRQILKLEKDLR